MTRSTLSKLTLSMLLLSACGPNVVLGKDDAASTGSAGSGAVNGGSAGEAGSATSGGAGGSTPTDPGSSDASTVDALPGPVVHDPGIGHFKVLVFTRTLEFMHDSIAAGVNMLRGLGATGGDFDIVETNEPGAFNERSLAPFAVVVFLNTTGRVLTATGGPEAAAFQSYMTNGGGFVGIHAAADTERLWPWYGDLLGAYLSTHDIDGTPGTVLIDQTTSGHPATLGLPSPWNRVDEWYTMSRPLAPEITVLASLDEPAQRPVSWIHELAGGGRMFYTTQGHNRSCYAEPYFQKHILGAIEWAAHRQEAKPAAPPAP